MSDRLLTMFKPLKFMNNMWVYDSYMSSLVKWLATTHVAS